MPVWIRSVPCRVTALTLVALLAACTSFVPGTAAKLRALDPATDDLASLVVALDLPSVLRPVPELSHFGYDVTGPGGERHVVATLALTDPGELAGTLPPPSNGRSYYLFGFSETDKAALREAQAFARSMPASTTTTALPVSVNPKFCTVAPIDLAKASFSVLLALPGVAGLQPLVRAQPIGTTLDGAPLPAC